MNRELCFILLSWIHRYSWYNFADEKDDVVKKMFQQDYQFQ